MEPTGTNSGPAGAAAAGAVARNPEEAELLQRRAAGEKLSPAEYGRLGAFSRWLKNPFGKTGAAAQSAAGPVGNAARVGSGEAGQASPDSMESVPIDADLARGVTNALLGRANIAASGWIEREATATLNAIRSNGPERDKMLSRIRVAANLKAADQQLISDLSPYVCEQLGVNPAMLAVYAVGGILGLHAFNLWQCVEELKDLRAQQKEPEDDPPAPKTAMTAEAVSRTTIPVPPRPKGAPPEFNEL